MITVPLKSTLLKSASFDSRRQEIQVTFQNGKTQTYCAVSRMTFLQLVRARSVGRFYRRVIMGKYAQVSESRKSLRSNPGPDCSPAGKREARSRNFQTMRLQNDPTTETKRRLP